MPAHDHATGAGVTVGGGALHEVVPGVFAWVQPDGSWWLNNAGAVRAGDEVLVVDTCATEQRTRRFLDAVAEATGGATVRWAVNTHQHGDHTYGNSLLPEGATLIGHDNMRAGLAADPIIDGCPPFWSPVPDWGAVERRLPDVTTSSDITVFAGERRVELRHPGGPAHTTGDLVAWLPDERVLFTGDLVFSGLTPLVFMGSIDGALRSLDWIAGFDPVHLVPGHGELVTAGDVDRVLGEHERYYRFVDEAAAGADGRSPLEVAQALDLGELAAWADAERIVLNLHRAIADRTGTPMDLVQALTDAVAYNGGPLTTHVCCIG